MFQYGPLHVFVYDIHHSLTKKKLNNLLALSMPHLNSFKVSQPPNATEAPPSTRGLSLLAGPHNVLKVLFSHYQKDNHSIMIRYFKHSLVSVQIMPEIPSVSCCRATRAGGELLRLPLLNQVMRESVSRFHVSLIIITILCQGNHKSW